MLIGNHLQTVAEGTQQFTRCEQKIRIPWPTPGFVALRKGFHQQYATGQQGIGKPGEVGTVQIVADDNGGELLAGERLGSCFKIKLPYLNARVAAQPGNTAYIDIHCGNRMTTVSEQPGMPPLAAGQIEHTAACRYQMSETQYPGRWHRTPS